MTSITEKIWPRTNEHLPSIIAGLDVKPDDNIIAVLGSGDQALALLEHSQRVLAVDDNSEQIEYTKLKLKYLKSGDYKKFFKAREGSSQTHQFRGIDTSSSYLTKERLGSIRKNLKNLEIRKLDIVNAIQSKRGFNKFYLSNALTCRPENPAKPIKLQRLSSDPFLMNALSNLQGELKIISYNLPTNGLAYLAEDVPYAVYYSGLKIDQDLTSRIKDPCWKNPVVLRRVD